MGEWVISDNRSITVPKKKEIDGEIQHNLWMYWYPGIPNDWWYLWTDPRGMPDGGIPYGKELALKVHAKNTGNVSAVMHIDLTATDANGNSSEIPWYEPHGGQDEEIAPGETKAVYFGPYLTNVSGTLTLTAKLKLDGENVDEDTITLPILPPTCTEGETKCDPTDPNVLLTCVNGKWQGTTCLYGCEELYPKGARCREAPEIENPVWNPGFESGNLDEWQKVGSEILMQVSSVTASEGTYSFRARPKYDQSDGEIYQYLKSDVIKQMAATGKEIKMRINMYNWNDRVTNGVIFVELSCLDINGHEIYVDSWEIRTDMMGTGWNDYTSRFSPLPDDTEMATLTIGFRNIGPEGEKLYIDDVSLKVYR